MSCLRGRGIPAFSLHFGVELLVVHIQVWLGVLSEPFVVLVVWNLLRILALASETC
jgi:hypothetical protein